jgi:hypothetical protein
MAQPILGKLMVPIVIVFIAVLCEVGYRAINERGWIPHTDKVRVFYAPEGWEVGEYISCEAGTLPESGLNLQCTGTGPAGAVREMDVTFWGTVSATPRFRLRPASPLSRRQLKVGCAT